MKQIGLIIMAIFLFYSCSSKSTNENNRKIKHISIPTKSSKQLLTKEAKISDNSGNISNPELTKIFAKAVLYFPKDSSSLYRFYFEWNSTREQNKIDKQINRLEKLISEESVDRYRYVEKLLKPLMTKIVNSNTVTKSQSDSLVKLYSDFDYFSGESLFSQLLTNDDNYNLVWESFRIMVKESKTDTCFLSGLIQLNKNIRTNVELGEVIQGFVVKAIRNNPYGFLDMYKQRNDSQRTNFANFTMIWDSTDKELIEKYSEISKNSTDENYRKLATELIEKLKN